MRRPYDRAVLLAECTPSLFDRHPLFDGPDLEPADHVRLSQHLQRVLDLMQDGHARTLDVIASGVGCTPQGASARLRDLRKAKFGGYTVERQRVSGGLFAYRLVLVPAPEQVS